MTQQQWPPPGPGWGANPNRQAPAQPQWPSAGNWNNQSWRAYPPPQQPYPQQPYPQQPYPPYPPQPYPQQRPQPYQPQQPGTRPWQPQPQYQIPNQPYPALRQPQQGGYYFQPPKKRNPLGLIVLAAVGIFVTAGFFISLANYLSFEDNPVVYPTQYPAPLPTDPAPDPFPPPDTDIPDPDKNPPPLPAPDSYSEATAYLENNPIYEQSVTAVDCGVGKIDITEASKNELEAHFNELTACLWQVWNPPLTQVGFTMPRPPVTVYGSSVETACGRAEDHNALYCAADQRIYYATNVYETLPRKYHTQPFVADTVVAHEFGHAIQARTAILVSSFAWEEKENTSEAKAAEFSRRSEMQADCLAGMFTTAVAQANGLGGKELKALTEVVYNIGDDVLSGKKNYSGDHGTGKARQRWFADGQKSVQIGTCNTYVAESAQVR
ncbi:MAG: neutral zinc metallopeptidase [Propionibacteriaceae bacterium]|nr:neutral zinc metallopeptidase [Propionibacteriaceae bacterium]